MARLRHGFALCAMSSVALASSACFGPALPDGLVCAETGLCPKGLLCDQGMCVDSPVGDVCSDGVVGDDENCDDGNTDDGDGCSADCQTATCLVPNTHPTIGEILLDPGCPRVFVSPGVYRETLVVDRPVELIGVGLGDKVIDADSSGTVVTVGPHAVTIRDLVLREGLATDGGGILNDGDLVLDGVTVTDSRAVDSVATGGGIFHRSGSLIVRASLIEGNTAEATIGNPTQAYGGGIYAEAPLTIEGGTIVRGNLARAAGPAPLARGGGINSVGTTFDADDCTLESNRAEGDAVSGVTGDAFARGGGVGVRLGQGTVAGCVFRDNEAVANSSAGTIATATGGGLFATQSTIAVTGAIFDSNRVSVTGTVGMSGNGGGVQLIGGTAMLDDITLDGNSVTSVRTGDDGGQMGAGGGGVDAVNVDNLVLAGSRIHRNTADSTSAGGAISSAAVSIRSNFGAATNVTISGCDIFDNRATSTNLAAAAGVNLSAAASVFTARIENTTVRGNRAEGPVLFGIGVTFGWNDGGVGTDSEFVASMVNSTISGNTGVTGGGGGGVAVIAGTGDLSRIGLFNVTIADNSTDAPNGGGGFVVATFAPDPAQIEIANSVIVDNLREGAPNNCNQAGAAAIVSRFTFWGEVDSCASLTSTGDTIGVDPMLVPLADNGGGTMTYELPAGSPALDQGDPAGCSDDVAILTTDQRGLQRPMADCDPGAFERQ